MPESDLPDLTTVWQIVLGSVAAVATGVVGVWRFLVVLPRKRKAQDAMAEEQPSTGQFSYYQPQLLMAMQDIQRKVEDLAKSSQRNDNDHARIERSQEMEQDLLRTSREEMLLLRQEIRYLGDAIKDLAQRINNNDR